MAATNREIDVAEETQRLRDPSALRTTMIGSTVIFWIFAIFMIHAMNSLRAELKAMREQMNALIRVTSAHSPGQYRVVDPEGNVIYSFERVPERLFDQLDWRAGADGEPEQPSKQPNIPTEK